MSFAVVRVDQDYDYVEGIECLYVFPTEQEARDKIQKINDERDAAWKNRCDYIEGWVNAIQMPDVDYHGWVEYLKQYPFGRYVFPKDFKDELKGYLRTHYVAELEGYDPPDAPLPLHNLFDVEIKDENRSNNHK